MLEDGVSHLLLVDESAIGRTEIVQVILAIFQNELSVMARDRTIVNLQRVIGQAAYRYLVLGKIVGNLVLVREKDLNLGHGVLLGGILVPGNLFGELGKEIRRIVRPGEASG